MKNTIKFIVMAVLSAVTALIVCYFAPKPIAEPETSTEITTTATTAKAAPEWLKKYADVKDLVAYIKVPNTDIDDPVVQSKDNNYYLRKNIYGEYSFSGCYFVDYECDMANLSQNTIIYGHNLRDKSRLFGQLTRYKKLDFYKKSPVISFDTKTQEHKWKVFSVFLTNNKKEDGEKFYYLDPNFKTQADFLKFATEITRRSIINTPVDVLENDKILLLSTCDYTVDNDWRLVIAARMVRGGEDETVDVSKAEMNPSPQYPYGWYRRFGGQKPTFADQATK